MDIEAFRFMCLLSDNLVGNIYISIIVWRNKFMVFIKCWRKLYFSKDVWKNNKL